MRCRPDVWFCSAQRQVWNKIQRLHSKHEIQKGKVGFFGTPGEASRVGGGRVCFACLLPSCCCSFDNPRWIVWASSTRVARKGRLWPKFDTKDGWTSDEVMTNWHSWLGSFSCCCFHQKADSDLRVPFMAEPWLLLPKKR